MEFRKSDHIVSFFKPVILILTLIFLLTAGSAFSQEKSKDKEKSKKKKKISYDVKLNLDVIYDDNILKYSEKYLERFMNQMDYGRFHIETYDDVILSPSVLLAGTFKLFKKMNSRFNADFSHYEYIVNDVKNWNSFSLGYQQFFTKKASFKILYNYIPEFYVRHFRDADWVDIYGYIPETFQPYSFAKDNYGFWIQNTFFKSTRVRAYMNYARYYHNEHFTEYDCKNLEFGVNLNQNLHKKLRLDLGYEFVTSDAVGYDEPGETKQSSDDADASFIGDEFSAGVVWQLPAVFKLSNNLTAGVTYAMRYYTTDQYIELDPEHAGRLDNVLNITASYNVRINKAWNVAAFFKWMGRDSSTSSELNSNYVSNEKDYRQAQIGLEATYNFKF